MKLPNPFSPTPAEKEFAAKMDASFRSLRVSGRGAVHVDVREVQASPEFKANLVRAKKLIK